jgi:hypothetical protein
MRLSLFRLAFLVEGRLYPASRNCQAASSALATARCSLYTEFPVLPPALSDAEVNGAMDVLFSQDKFL